MSSAIETYLENGRIPWSTGYSKYKNQVLKQALTDAELMARFAAEQPLPPEYGCRLDERMVEYPWVISRLVPSSRRVLDAGSTFSAPLILDLPQLRDRSVVIYTLETDWVGSRSGVSYAWGDLRHAAFRDAAFDTVVCISTLEHVGMAQSFEYSMQRPYLAAKPASYKDALVEFSRVLRAGGNLLLTVPFGRQEYHGWLQQYDQAGIADIVATFDGSVATESFYHYDANGWQVATADDCRGSEYFNIHANPDIEPDGAAAARAVCCLNLVKR